MKQENTTLSEKAVNIEQCEGESGIEGCHFRTKDVKSSIQRFLKEEIKKICFGEIDWIEVIKDAYESRKTSWNNIGEIREWRNATDEILFAFWKQFKPLLDTKAIEIFGKEVIE